MLGLRRRATEGGSWRARLSLERTALWLDSLGRREPTGKLDITGLMRETDSASGPITHVRMPGTLRASPPRWDRGSPLPGADKPVFAA